ncbi:MAG: DEAD/DEAH box helicase family protein [Clostridium sp.]|uniref:DEAD/DEAH box helicase family protein n=1 Tax=Clostridium sp. TaxID=1506 RepID=UPI0039E95091
MKKLNLKWVTDSIGEDYKEWDEGDIIILQAQTGTGKTYFIKNKLINYINPYERLLLVCNRINLKRQLKIDLLKKYHLDVPHIKDKDGNDTKKIDLKALDRIYQIENITIKSYQSIGQMAINHEYDGKEMDLTYDYIVMDEAHYILADGGFNNKCRLAYKYLVKQHMPNTVKIFISATMEEVEVPIIHKVQNTKTLGYKPKLKQYYTGTDYSYVNPIYFQNNLSIIINSIKNDKSDEKWLIFVTSKDNGRKIQKELGDEISSCIFKDTKNEELESIIQDSKFNKKVLIATKVIDNGINIVDDKLTNIVIMAWDRITFIQELGRKRIDIENPQQINLYIPTKFMKSFMMKSNECEYQLGEIKLLEEDPNAFNKKYDNDMVEISKMNHLFFHENMKTGTGKWMINLMGKARTNIDLKFYKQMMMLFKKDRKFAFIHTQLSWLGLDDTFNESKLVEEVALEDEVESLEEYLNNAYNNDIRYDKKTFINEIEKIIEHCIGSNLDELLNKLDGGNNRNRGLKQYNKLFSLLEFDYIVTSKKFKINGKLKTKWIIVKEDK